MDINILALDIWHWANSVFPDRTDASMFMKLYKEIGELLDVSEDGDPSDEIADVLILLLDYGRRKNVNISLAVQRKLRTNKSRTWAVNHLGVMQHVEAKP